MQKIQKITGILLLLVIAFGLQIFALTNEEAYQLIDHMELKILVDADMKNFLLTAARNPEEWL